MRESLRATGSPAVGPIRHALPIRWEQLDYDELLDKRRKLVAQVVRDGFANLSASGKPSTVAEPASIEELIARGESSHVELKSTARWNLRSNAKDPRLEHTILKTVAGFLNHDGGTLLIGVSDEGGIVGAELDYQPLQKPGRDGYELWLLGDLLKTGLSGAAYTLVRVSFAAVDGHDVCRVDVAASARAVFVRGLDGKEPTEFWARVGNSTRQLVGAEMVQYQEDHWE